MSGRGCWNSQAVMVACGSAVVFASLGGCSCSGGSSTDDHATPGGLIVGEREDGAADSFPRWQDKVDASGACATLTEPSGTCPPDARCASIGFATAVQYPVLGAQPTFVAAGFFNDDPHLDIATANISSDTVSILLGVGDGTFGTAVPYPGGLVPSAMTLGDFDGDAKTDVVTASPNANGINVLRGNGDGTLRSPLTTTATSTPFLVVSGEFGDGDNLDVAGVSQATRRAQIFSGNGDGTFSPGATVMLDGAPVSLGAGDLDANGRPEIAVAMTTGVPGVAVISTAADGSIVSTDTYDTWLATTLAFGDFNGDGDLDIVYDRSGGLTIRFGAGDLSFPTSADVTLAAAALKIAASDIDRNGVDDMVVVQAGAVVEILFGEPGGVFTSQGQFAVDDDPNFAVIADFNGDRSGDIAISHQAPANTVTVLKAYATAPGCFGLPRTPGPCSSLVTCAAGDCCPSGYTCNDTDSSCETNTPPPLPSGGLCPADTVDVGDGCCPTDYPDGCGESCCLPGQCGAGECGCPGDTAACGDVCCEAGSACVDGTCELVATCGSADFSNECGTACCADGIICTNGECECPADYPVMCPGAPDVDLCCLAGGTCVDGACACPPDNAPCGELCCDTGFTCIDGSCEEGPDVDSGGGVTATDPDTAPATYTPADPNGGAGCGQGTLACSDDWCCAVGLSCAANPSDQLDCGTDYCCVGCSSGSPCGGGCCSGDTACTNNNGELPGCSADSCCEDLPPEDVCPPSVAAECPEGTDCRFNRSARLCPGSDYACYHPAGHIACPGEVLCPNNVEFCPANNRCSTTLGVCEVPSTQGAYCCKPADPCGVEGDWVTECPAGSTCSGCGNSTVEIQTFFTISPDIAFGGGSWIEPDDVSYTFDSDTCSLTSSFDVSNGCFTGTRVYTRSLMESSTTLQDFTCFTSACLCVGTHTCADSKL